jgi:hypothetical protein
MKWISVIIIFTTMFMGCVNIDNKDIINEDKFVDVLVDIHMADAIIVVKGYKINADSTKIRLYYNQVLVKHNVTQKQIENTFKYYTHKPKEFEKLYKVVSEKVAKKQEKYTEGLKAESKK